MDRFISYIKRAWNNRIIKTVIITAAGGAFGAVAPMLYAGTLVFNAVTVQAATAGAVSAVAALYVRKPEPPSAPKP